MPYETIGMLRSFAVTDELNMVNQDYFTEAKRAEYELSLVSLNTLAKGGDVNRWFIGQKPLLRRVDTSESGMWLFVMDGEGRVYAGSSREVSHHSVFLAGKPIASAGMLEADNGRLVSVSNHSGHYAPPREFLDQVLREIERRGVKRTSFKVNPVGLTKAQVRAAERRTGRRDDRL